MLALAIATLSPGALADTPPVAHVVGVRHRSTGFWDSWTEVEESTRAFVRRGDVELTVEVGMPLQAGDRVGTSENTQLTLKSADGAWTYEVCPDAALELTENALKLEQGCTSFLGEGLLNVLWRDTTTSVDGTVFTVRGEPSGHGEVHVRRGQVTVRSPLGEEQVRRGQTVQLVPGQPPSSPQRNPDARRRELELRDTSGSRPWSVGVMVGGGYGRTFDEAAGPRLSLDAFGRVELPGPLELQADLGLVSAEVVDHVPLSVGLNARFGPLGVGAWGSATLVGSYDCADRWFSLQARGGGGLTVSATHELTPRLALDGRVNAGWQAQGPGVDGAAGLRFRF